MTSKAFRFTKEDGWKVSTAFFYNLMSISSAVIIAILALPTDQLPPWLLWVIPVTPLINAILYAIKRWLADNTVSSS